VKIVFENILISLKKACNRIYNERLISLAVFGSVAASTMRPDSDIDILIVADQLPRGRMARVREFEMVDRICEESLKQAIQQGVRTSFSPHIKTPIEVRHGSPIFLDMTETIKILFDRDQFLENYLKDLRKRISILGAKKIRLKGGYYWLLKPDLKAGEEIIL